MSYTTKRSKAWLLNGMFEVFFMYFHVITNMKRAILLVGLLISMVALVGSSYKLSNHSKLYDGQNEEMKCTMQKLVAMVVVSGVGVCLFSALLAIDIFAMTKKMKASMPPNDPYVRDNSALRRQCIRDGNNVCCEFSKIRVDPTDGQTEYTLNCKNKDGSYRRQEMFKNLNLVGDHAACKSKLHSIQHDDNVANYNPIPDMEIDDEPSSDIYNDNVHPFYQQ
jgi:hypothetical protein